MADKIRKLIIRVETDEGDSSAAVVDFNGNTIQWDGTPEAREAAKPALEAIWLALASDRFWEKPTS